MKKYCGFFDGIKLIVIMMLLSNILGFISTFIIYSGFNMAKAVELEYLFNLLMYLITLILLFY